MRYLISSFCLLFIACGPYPKKHNFQLRTTSNKTIHNPYFSDEKKDYVYKANIAVYDKLFSGIFIVKKLGEANHRIVFTTEMGNKIFDFSFLNDTFKVNFIIEAIDKAILINILKKDFKALIQEKIPVIKSYSLQDTLIYETALSNKKHFYFKTQQLNKIIRVKNAKEKVTFLFLEINNIIANQIKILHSNIKLKINLKSIN
ncbi:hypothetical protein Q4Q39_05965 [Flavivirga amylovorans]|uniref:DUF3261 domain-containing protein n=1 Tax=Flavivirga amylovorans TaxID=870486 RepID=A0ABT8WZZ0_9FLAO|nr:hypothetical protein [Flavivirga amylovorans]MDO5986949.1 hypothetical protein [Flavivirga amylovorans]